MRIPLSLIAASVVAIAAAACSHDSEAKGTHSEASRSTTTATARKMCEMVTAADVSSIVGALTVASEGSSSTTCHYKPVEGSTPSVEITVDWGGGHAAMTAAGMLSRHEPGIADPLAGLGDEAAVFGPAIWVRLGDDLVTLMLSGVADEIAVAKRIVGTMRPSLRQ